MAAMTPSSPTPPVRHVHSFSPPTAPNHNSFVFAPTSPQRHANPNLAAAVPRLSPRQVKLERVKQPAYALRFTLRDHVAANFQHELFQFHQTLRDVVARSERHAFAPPQLTHKQPSSCTSPPTSPYDRSVLELLTSDRGDAVLKELFHQWQLKRNSGSAVPDASDDGDSGDGDDDKGVLWDVLETFFKSVPLVLPESEVSNAKSYFRYMDALTSLRDVLLALLYKTPNKSDDNDEGSDEDESNGRSEQQDVGLLNDATVLMLLDFWELPKTERLGFFCQIASQTRDEDAAMLLQVFLDNCSTHNFLQVWEALQQAPQFESTFTAAAQHRFVDLSGLTEVFEERDDGDESALAESDSSSGSDDNGGGGRDFRKIMIREHGRTPPDQRHDNLDHPHRRRHHRNNRNDDHKQLRSVSPAEARANRGASSQHQLPPVNLQAPLLRRLHDDLVELIKVDDLSESDGLGRSPASAQVMDMVWKLLELLDKDKQRPPGSFRRLSSRSTGMSNTGSSGSHRIDSVVSNSSSLAPQGIGRANSTLLQDPTHHRQTLLLDANLSRDQQFAIKLDQLQSLLTALGAFSLHDMETETISSAYRRMPALVKLFSTMHGKTYEAAGVDASSGATYSKLSTLADGTQQQHHHASVASAAASQRSVSITPVALSASDDQVLEAASMLMSKVSKIVRSLADLDQITGGSRDTGDGKDTTANLDVLAILKLADDMESDAAGGNRRGTLIDHSRRLAILHKLKALAMSAEIDALAGMVSETVKDAHEQHVQQLQQIEKLSSAATGKQRRRRTSRLESVAGTEPLDDGDAGSDDGDDGVDEVLKMARKAKTRRASEVAAAVKAQQQPSPTADSDESDDESSSRPQALTNRRDVLLNFRQATTAQKGVKLFSVGILLRIIYQIYRESYESMVASPQYGNRRMGFSEFLYDWHIRKYGLKALAQQHLFKLIQSLRKFERKAFQCQLCLRFLGIQSPLGLLDKWSLGTFAGATKHRVEHSTRQFKIRIPFAVATLQEALSERFGVYFRSMDAVAARVRSLAMSTPGDEEFVKESDVLRVAIDEWTLQRQRLEQILEAVYVAGDLNGDGGLEFDEFAAVVAHLSPAVDDKLLLKVFAAAHDVVKLPRRISLARFIDVILLERILNTSAAGVSATSASRVSGSAANNAATGSKPGILGDDSSSGSRAAGSNPRTVGSKAASALASSQQEEEEALQFNLLQQTWEHDRDIVERALKLITHAATAASLTFRVSFLSQVIAKRVDSKTAWLCHRQIMRDISRYQNLDEAQIVVLKKKDETFRKAVLAITNLRKLGTLLIGGNAGSRVALDSGDVDTVGSEGQQPPVSTTHDSDQDVQQQRREATQGERRYTATVERTFEGIQRYRSQSRDMLELEDELREKFLASADEGAIEDFKVAVQQLRRMSRLSDSDSNGDTSSALGVSLDQLEALQSQSSPPPPSVEGSGEQLDEGDENGDEDREDWVDDDVSA
ncbi:hypothetical protein PybrP1_007991 [[Pythium] brassicae (nom. inval.)]|nr:hypothetical protein PybrP1_007991 [[Pythium] brassicae (nom. inval.)]